MANLREVVYLGRDNTVDLLLKADGVAQDLSSVTRMVLKDVAGEWEIDYNDYNDAFNWNTGVTGKVVLSLGDALNAESVAEGVYEVKLVLYDAVNTDGIIWPSEDLFTLDIYDE